MKKKIFSIIVLLIISFQFLKADIRGNLGRERLVEMLELPSYSNGKYKEKFAVRYRYSVSFNPYYRIPNWVAWKQIKDHNQSLKFEDKGFSNDEAIPECPTHGMYDRKYANNEEYDRGHLCPRSGSNWCIDARKSVDCMSNVVPQYHSMNRGLWKSIEGKCTQWSNDNFKELYIVSGPIIKSHSDIKAYYRFPDECQKPIAIPKSFFKAILGKTYNGEYYGIAYVVSNNDVGKSQAKYTTIDQIEKMTGYDLFHNLPKNVEQKVESVVVESKWPGYDINGKVRWLVIN